MKKYLTFSLMTDGVASSSLMIKSKGSIESTLSAKRTKIGLDTGLQLIFGGVRYK